MNLIGKNGRKPVVLFFCFIVNFSEIPDETKNAPRGCARRCREDATLRCLMAEIRNLNAFHYQKVAFWCNIDKNTKKIIDTIVHKVYNNIE